MIGDIKELNKNLKDIYKLKIMIGNSLNQITKKCDNKNIQNFTLIQKELDELWQSLKQ